MAGRHQRGRFGDPQALALLPSRQCLQSLGTICRNLAAFTHAPAAYRLSYQKAASPVDWALVVSQNNLLLEEPP